MSPTKPTPDSPDSLLRRVIAGNFRVEKLIGSGAMGNVYKAEQISLGKAVAVKVLHPHLMEDDKLVMRFKREAKSASLLNHPNSIQIIDSGQDQDGTLYIAMELLAGRDLAQVIRDDFPMPLPRIARIMSQVLSALDEAHAQGVIHRDLKPSNIMLIERREEADFVKVCDFGIAKAAQDAKDDRAAMLTIQGLVCGTPEYMAPEQARAEPLDGRADLYSAAVILYQLVTGDIPFRGDTPMAIVSRHLAEAPVPPSRKRPDLGISPAMDGLVLRGLEKNRELRFATGADFRDDLEAVASGVMSGRYTPGPLSLRSRMPTARMTGMGSGSMPGSASGERLGSDQYGEQFGSTAHMRADRSRTIPLVAMTSVLAIGAIAAAIILRRPAPAPAPAPAQPAPVAAKVVPSPPALATVPAPPPLPAPAQPVAAAPPEPVATPPATTPTPALPAQASAEPPAGRPTAGAAHVHHKRTAVAPPATAAAPVEIAAAPPAEALPVEEKAVRGPREVIGEAERLLAQGEVGQACDRGEEAKRMGPRLAPAYKFLGKCYMRAGKTTLGSDNYRKYLELAPNAPDAMFVKSIIK